MPDIYLYSYSSPNDILLGDATVARGAVKNVTATIASVTTVGGANSFIGPAFPGVVVNITGTVVSVATVMPPSPTAALSRRIIHQSIYSTMRWKVERWTVCLRTAHKTAKARRDC